MDQWEQRVVHVATTEWKTLDLELQRLGAEGWEVVGMAGVDKTVGINALFAVVKRPLVPPTPLTGQPAEWHPDPCGRWELRYWNGQAWTAHVANRATKEKAVDPPQTLPSSDYSGG